MIQSTFSWVRRQGVVFLLIVAAVAFHHFIYSPNSVGGIGETVGNEWRSPSEIKAELTEFKQQTLRDIGVEQTALLAKSGAALDNALMQKRAELKGVQAALAKHQGIFASIRPSAIIEREKFKLRQTRLVGEINVLTSLKRSRADQLALDEIFYPTQLAVDSAWEACQSANKSVRTYNDLNVAEKVAKKFLYGTPDKLTRTAKNQCGKFMDLRDRRREGRIKGEAALEARDASNAALSKAVNGFQTAISDYSPEVQSQTISALLLKALVIFVVILATPFVIRIIFYYILAPIAERRASVRISVPGGGTVPIPLSEPSRVSVPVTLGASEELLVRQDYLQTSSLTGKKETRWLLDYRHMLSSIASGLSFLTRIRGDRETTTVSAVRDPFAELTEVVLATGAASVLHPRALVAVVQPIGVTLRITSHWRLLSLNAWLTFQLRYLVFHGPCRLIIKGGRGIRLEPAISGRIFGQDQLVGFSTDLSYSVTRTETFWPYFFGREQLFKDKVEKGSGILIIEEAPLSSRQGAGVRRGLEGVFDASLKAFGL